MATKKPISTVPQQGGRPGDLGDDAVFQSLLFGLQGSLKRAFDLQSVLFTFNDTYKARLLNDNNVAYPRATVKISNVEVLRNINNYSTGRRGLVAKPKRVIAPQGPDGEPMVGEDYVRVFNFVQVKLTCELHIFDNDRRRNVKMTNDLALLIGTSRLAFSATIDDAFQYYAQPDFETNLPVPDQAIAENNDKGVMDLTASFTIQGYVGRVDRAVRMRQTKFRFDPVNHTPQNPAWWEFRNRKDVP